MVKWARSSAEGGDDAARLLAALIRSVRTPVTSAAGHAVQVSPGMDFCTVVVLKQSPFSLVIEHRHAITGDLLRVYSSDDEVVYAAIATVFGEFICAGLHQLPMRARRAVSALLDAGASFEVRLDLEFGEATGAITRDGRRVEMFKVSSATVVH